MSGFAMSDAATWSRIAYDPRVNADFPVSKFTPRNISVGRAGAPGVISGWNRLMQPLASTFEPGGVFGHLSSGSKTPSESESRMTSVGRGQPLASTRAPAGV